MSRDIQPRVLLGSSSSSLLELQQHLSLFLLAVFHDACNFSELSMGFSMVAALSVFAGTWVMLGKGGGYSLILNMVDRLSIFPLK